MKKVILMPMVLGTLASVVITGCTGGGDDKEKKQPCDYSISGGNSVELMLGTAYTKPSVKVTSKGKPVTFEQEGTVNTNKLGTYTLKYTGKSCENSKIRTIKVVPSSCAYSLKGSNPFQLGLGEKFVEPGFEVKDINNKVVQGEVTGRVDTSTVGKYTLTYKGQGCQNSQQRVVQVTKGSCEYTLKGDNPLLLDIGNTYNDAGVVVKNADGKEVASSVSGSVDTAIAGNYDITYQGVGCSNTKIRKVTVKLTAGACVYKLKGENPLEVIEGNAYTELGVSITNINNKTVKGIVSGSVNSSKVGEYTIIYQSDQCTNEMKRIVKVVPAECSYTLKGDNPLLLDKGDKFVDLGVTIKDANNKVVTSSTTGEVNTTKLGDYTLTYKGKGCPNSVTRVVGVKLQTCTYKLFGKSPLNIIVNSAYSDPGAEIKDKKGVVLESKVFGATNVNNTKEGVYVVTYQSTACENSQSRIVKVRTQTTEELQNSILPSL